VGSRGWAIAMPTDIAFTLGILALAVRNAPVGLRSFVLTLAIVDDILTVVVIAVFYPAAIRFPPLLLAIGIGGAMALLRRMEVRAMALFVAFGVAMWLSLDASGVEPALAGVVVGLLTPAFPLQRPRHVSEEAIRVADETVDEPDPPDADAHWWLRLAWLSKEAVSPLARIEHMLLPWTTFAVLPLFALANAGVRLSIGSLADALSSPVTLGVVIGHVAGKILEIGGAVWLAVRLGIGRLPDGTRLGTMFAVATAAGVAFTVSLFVADVAFIGRPGLVEQAKIGILLTALVAGPVGYAWLRHTTRSGTGRARTIVSRSGRRRSRDRPRSGSAPRPSCASRAGAGRRGRTIAPRGARRRRVRGRRATGGARTRSRSSG
jgi:NhaA family Na+:H+ antiporter